MAELQSQSNAYKNQKRNQAKILTREALFVNEYIQIKHENIYNEAAAFYNQLNKKHDRKPDLRKTNEFRIWKNQMAAAKGQPQTKIPREKEYTYNRTQYKDIVIFPTAEIPKEKPKSFNLLTMDLNIPLMAIPQHSTANGIVMENDQSPDPPATQAVTVIQEGDQVPIPFIEDDLLIDPSITDQLMPEIVNEIIHDLQSDPCIKDLIDGIENIGEEIPEPEIVNEIIHDLQPDPCVKDLIDGGEEIPEPEIVNQIIHDLQSDPCVKDLMDGIEEEIPELELEIDLPNDPLEEESLFW